MTRDEELLEQYRYEILQQQENEARKAEPRSTKQPETQPYTEAITSWP